MRRGNTMLVLLLVALVCLAGALLPSVVARVQDRMDNGRVSYAEVGQIHLEFDSSGMTLREKMALLSGLTSSMQVSADMTKHTPAEVWTIAMETAETYREAGLIPTTLAASDIAYCIPVMAYWEQYEGVSQIHSNIFWELSIADGGGGDNALTMTIDDRTGVVCTLSYQNVTTHRTENVRLEKALETLCGLALSDLGEEFAEYDPKELVDAAGINENTSSYAAADIAWEDATHGEVRLAFVVSEVGFYTYTY